MLDVKFLAILGVIHISADARGGVWPKCQPSVREGLAKVSADTLHLNFEVKRFFLKSNFFTKNGGKGKK